jgi:uncharacterized membrane protein
VLQQKPGTVEDPTPVAPPWASIVRATRSGYVETAHPERLLPLAAQHHVSVLIRPRVGEHVVEGTPLAWVWAAAADDPAPDGGTFEPAVGHAVRIGFERTLEQDAAFGIRQLVDIACKALSPAVNDPYTAVQAIDHLSVIFAALAARPLGDDVARDAASGAVVIAPARRFGDYLATMCGLIRRFGAQEPTVSVALLRLLGDCRTFVGQDATRLAEISRQGELILEDAERSVAQPADLAQVREAAGRLARSLA